MEADHRPHDAAADDLVEPRQDDEIVVYWRDGCFFCSSLLRRLERTGLEFQRIDIWDDPDGAAFVRSVAGGNETVPTVRVGSRALVNPSAAQVLDVVGAEVPHRRPTPDEAPDRGPIAGVVDRLRKR